MKDEIVNIVRELSGLEPMYFDSGLKVKLSPHTHPLELWAVCVSPSGQIYLMEYSQEWHELKSSDLNYDKVLNSLYQRLKTIKKTAA